MSTLNDPKEREQFGHHLEQQHGWKYETTHVLEKDHPNGWDFMSTRPEGFELNVDKRITYDGEREGHEIVEPGVLRWPRAASGVMLVAHWRRQVFEA